jgi:hypothetical protein
VIRFNILVFIFFLLIYSKSISQSWADIPIKVSKIKHEIGFSFGMNLGYGPSYKVWRNRLAGQIAFAPLINAKVSGFTSGIGFYYLIQEFKYSRQFFLYQSNRFRYFNNNTNDRLMYFGAGVMEKNIQNELLISSGIGIGYGFSRKKQSRNPWIFNMMAGYAAYKSFSIGSATLDFSFMYRFSRKGKQMNYLKNP